MKKIVFIILLLPSIVFSQSSNFEAEEFNSDPLVPSNFLPIGFKNIVSDTVNQILLFPSKGANFNRNFYFVNYSPSTSYGNQITNRDYPSFSLSYFKGKSQNKTLFQFDFEQIYSKSNTELLSDDEPYASFQNNTSDNEQNEIIARVKLDFIRGDANKGTSFGIFGKVNQTSFYSYHKSDVSDYSFYQFSTVKNTRRVIDNSNSDKEQNELIYSIGAEYSKTSKTSSFSSELNFHHALKELKHYVTSDYLRLDSSYTISQNVETLSEYTSDITKYISNTKIDHYPISVGLKNYFERKTDNSKRFFLRSDLVYSIKGKTKANVNGSNISVDTYNGQITDTDSTEINDIQKTKDTKNYRADFSAGYIYEKQFLDIRFVTGVSVDYSYKKTQDIYFSEFFNTNVTQISYETVDWSSKVNIPFYLYYSPVKWFSTFGVFNSSYLFTYLKDENARFDNEFPELLYSDKNTNKRFNTSSTFALGVSLKHKSGIVTHIAFNGDLGEISNWNISLGYLF